MKVLVTGAFGNIGVHTVNMLLKKEYEVSCFARKNFYREWIGSRRFAGKVNMLWGDLRNKNELMAAVKDQEVVIHLAATIPPKSEMNPTASYAINVTGTQQLIQMLESMPTPPLLIFTSSVTVHGANPNRSSLIKASDPVIATDAYTTQKIEAERLIKNSTLNWVILRVSASVPLVLTQVDPLLFAINLNTRVEFVHPNDVALAIVNCIGNKAVYGKTLMIGGGHSCQMLYKDMIQQLLDSVGIGMFPESAFSTKPSYLDWMDTTESQRLLQYQQHSFTDFLHDLKKLVGWRKPFIHLFRPLIRRQLLNLSNTARNISS